MWSRVANASLIATNLRAASLRHVAFSSNGNRPYSSVLLLNGLRSSPKPLNKPSIRSQSTKEGEILSSKPKETKNTKSYDPNLKKLTSSYSSANLKFLAVFVSGVAGYFGLSYYIDHMSKKPVDYSYIDYSSQYLPGRIVPSKSIVREKNPGNLKITLYQYATCPFCCKVRAYLDYYGYSYDIVEVNSITRKQTNWSSYKKVPIVAVQVPNENDPTTYEENILQFNDSSLIISALETFRLDPSTSIKQIKTYFEPLKIDSNDANLVTEFTNKYFVMIHNSNASKTKGSDLNEIKYEREWRKWADAKFVHVISPNVYRTLGESIEAFKWFDDFGEWSKHFNSLERSVIIYSGAFVMYFIGKKLKKKHELKDDVRESMYDLCAEWVSALSPSKPFCGGTKLNLGDLALFGVMNSFEGCQAFTDMINNTQINTWYQACKDAVRNNKGKQYLHEGSKNAPKSSKADAFIAPPTQNRRKFFYFF